VQSQCRDKKEKDNYDPYVREKVQSKRTQFFFIKFKSFDQPWNIGMPQNQSDNPVEQREENSNDNGAQEKVSEEDDFFAFHVSSVTSDARIDARLSGHEICVNKRNQCINLGHASQRNELDDGGEISQERRSRGVAAWL
jgi:hypothetical protein